MLEIKITIDASPILLDAIQGLSMALSGAKTYLTRVDVTPQQSETFQPPVAPVAPTPMPAPASAPMPAAAPMPAPVPIPAAVPTATQTYSFEQLAVAATPLIDSGRRSELTALLAQFGIQALTQLPKEHYGAFATQLRALGAKI